jgi:uncharacterized membrane protein
MGWQMIRTALYLVLATVLVANLAYLLFISPFGDFLPRPDIASAPAPVLLAELRSPNVAIAISADGGVIAGDTSEYGTRGFVWTAETGMQPGPVPTREMSRCSYCSVQVVGISDDGNTLLIREHEQAWFWSESGLPEIGMFALRGSTDVVPPQSRGPSFSEVGRSDHDVRATALSGDGRTAVGSFIPPGTSLRKAFRATSSNVIEELGDLRHDGRGESEAVAVSADGSTIFGWVYDEEDKPQTFRWMAGWGLEPVDLLSGFGDSDIGYRQITISGVTRDGQTLVGYVDGSPWRVFRWTEFYGVEDLGLLGSSDAQWIRPTAISDDGNVIVGFASVPDANGVPDERAFRWSDTDGFHVLAVPQPHILKNSRALDVSADGRIVVGEVH